MADDRDAKNAWIKRELGLEIRTFSGGQPDLSRAVANWQDALDRLNSQIAALQSVLRSAPDEDLHEIAEFGLNAMTANHRVKIQAALMDVQSGAPNPGKTAAAAKLVASFAAHIASDKRIAACDTNPFGVPLSIRNTLMPALDGLASALQMKA